MTEYDQELQKWNKKNVFMDNEFFNALQMSLVPIKILYGNYQTYQTQVCPNPHEQWNHLIFLPGTAFKFCNKKNEQYTAKNILSIMDIKNIPLKFHIIDHRINPVFPQALQDTLEMIKILVQQQKPKRVTIMTWSAGCCHLGQISQFLSEIKCSIQRIIMISPVVDLSVKQRKPTSDFLNNDFFEFVEKYYCKNNINSINSLSLLTNLENQKENNFLLKIPAVTILYGDSQFILDDIQAFIKILNEENLKIRQKQVDRKCFIGENHAMYSFVTSGKTFQNKETVNQLATKKWKVNKYICDQLERDLFSRTSINISLE